jgi:hypothetical protein
MLALLAFAALELCAHAVTRAHVPSSQDFRAAAAFVRASHQAADLIVAAPAWADPLVREALGDRIDLAMAGRSDTAAYQRLWVMSIRGARSPEAPPGPPELSRSFGRVRVERFSLGKSAVRYDFVEQLGSASVGAVQNGEVRACAWRSFPASRGGGLGVGALPPPQRFACDGGGHGAWVGSVVQESLDLLPRRCIRAAPVAAGPLRISFPSVPLGDRIVLYGGLYYEDERMREGGPVLTRVLISGHEAGLLTHRDGDGWKRLELATAPGVAEVAFEISAPDPRRRGFCFAANTRLGPDHARVAR